MSAGHVAAGSHLPRSLLGNLAVAGVLVAIAGLFLPLHDAAWWLAAPPPVRLWWAGGVLLAWLAASALWLRSPKPQTELAAPGDGPEPVLVAWASQTGFAQSLAERSAAMLREGGVPVTVLPLQAVDAALLARSRRALFLASTTGEGDPPDHALAFLRHTLAQAVPLADLEYAVLALGDREYQDFCAFGRQLDQWLRGNGARALFGRVEVDNADPAALRHWQYEVAASANCPTCPTGRLRPTSPGCCARATCSMPAARARRCSTWPWCRPPLRRCRSGRPATSPRSDRASCPPGCWRCWTNCNCRHRHR